MIASVDLGHKDDITVETTFRKDKNGSKERNNNRRGAV